MYASGCDAMDRGGLGKGGQVTLCVDGKKVGEGAVPTTQAMVFSADEGCDVGEDGGAPFLRTTARVATPSMAGSRGCNSLSMRPRRAWTISFPERKLSAAPWRASRRISCVLGHVQAAQSRSLPAPIPAG